MGRGTAAGFFGAVGVGLAIFLKPYWHTKSGDSTAAVELSKKEVSDPEDVGGSILNSRISTNYIELDDALRQKTSVAGLISCATNFSPYLNFIQIGNESTRYDIQRIREYEEMATRNPQVQYQVDDAIRQTRASMSFKLSSLMESEQVVSKTIVNYCPKALREIVAARDAVNPDSDGYAILEGCRVEMSALLADEGQITLAALNRGRGLTSCNRVAELAQVALRGE